jgi:ribosome-associated toxin RatA of RatAB toxin-antitoxin module
VQWLPISLAVLWTAPVAAFQLPQAMTAPECVACGVDGAYARRVYTDEQWEELTSGKILSGEVGGSDKSEQGGGAAVGIIRYPPEQVWTVVADFEARPKYVANAKEVHIVQVDGDRVWLSQHLKVLLTNVRFGTICTLQPERGVLSWVLDDSAHHDIADTRGSWQLTPLADRHETLVTYRAWINSGRYVPGFIENFLLKRSLPELIAGLRDEVRRRFGP